MFPLFFAERAFPTYIIFHSMHIKRKTMIKINIATNFPNPANKTRAAPDAIAEIFTMHLRTISNRQSVIGISSCLWICTADGNSPAVNAVIVSLILFIRSTAFQIEGLLGVRHSDFVPDMQRWLVFLDNFQCVRNVLVPYLVIAFHAELPP